MLVVISPAKKLDWSETPDLATTEPVFPQETAALTAEARKLGVDDLRKLMGISEDLAKLNHARFQSFSDAPAPEDLRPAAFAFAGDTYVGLEARTLDPDALRWSQDHLRILSGLYGLLRPLDRIQPYRLEMGSRLKTPRGKSLYDWWGDQIALALNAAGEASGTEMLLNCASTEYFTAANRAALKLRIVTPVFLEENGKIVSFHAKKARGAMARHVMENRLTTADEVRSFEAGGYRFRAEDSTDCRLVFQRAG